MKKVYWFASLVTVALFAAVASAVPVTDGLIIHLRADDLALNDGDPVTIWSDSAIMDAANGTVKAYTGYGVPIFKTNVYNGMPAVRFIRALDPPSVPNSEKHLLVSNQWSWNKTQGVTVFIFCTGGIDSRVTRPVQVGKTGGIVNKTVGCDASSNQSGLTDTGSGVRYNNGWCCTATAGPNPVQQGVWHASVRQIAQGGAYGSLFYAVNNVTPLAVTTNKPTQIMNFDNGGNDITLGNGWQGGSWPGLDWYDGDIAEVLVYNKQLTEDQMQQVMDFLKNKYDKLTAHNPSPANKDVGQGTLVGDEDDVEVTFTWNTGLDPDNPAAPNPDITNHYFYLVADEPNFVDVLPIPISAGSPTEATGSYGPIVLSTDRTYYWRVDERVEGSGPGDPNLIVGPVWSFETIKAVPIIVEQPGSVAVFPGQEASFTIDVTSVSPADFEWYKSVDNIPSVDDTLKGQEQTLTLSDVQISDEGYYYCKVVNESGEENAVYSTVAMLGIKRKVAHWTLDLSDYVNGQYLDSGGEGHHADPNLQPDLSQFVAGADPTETNEGLNIAAKPLSAAKTADSFAAAAFTGEVTLSAWVKWAGPNGLWQGVACNRGSDLDPEGNAANFLLEIRKDNGNLQINASYLTALESVNLPVDRWAHVVMTAGAAQFAIYIDGLPVATRTPGTAIRQNIVPMYLGAISRNASGLTSSLNGVIDDVRIYNYIKDRFEIADLYYEVAETPLCLNPDGLDLIFDVAGGGLDGTQPDCLVNLIDFAVFAVDWLNCGLYPQEDCQ